MANQFQVVGREDHRLHRYLPAAIRIRREEGKSVGVDYDNWRDLAREVADKPFSWKKRRFLEIVDDRSEYEYGSVSFQWNDYPLFGCGSIEELHDLVTGLNDDNYIQLDEQSMSLNSFRCRLGTEGKEWLQGSPSYLELFGTETSGLPKDVHTGLLKCLRRRRDGDISGAMTAACGVVDNVTSAKPSRLFWKREPAAILWGCDLRSQSVPSPAPKRAPSRPAYGAGTRSRCGAAKFC